MPLADLKIKPRYHLCCSKAMNLNCRSWYGVWRWFFQKEHEKASKAVMIEYCPFCGESL